MRRQVAQAWLAFLRERQPHKRIEFHHIGNILTGWGYEQAIRRLRTLATQYPNDWIVFQTQQRLLGNFTAEDFQ